MPHENIEDQRHGEAADLDQQQRNPGDQPDPSFYQSLVNQTQTYITGTKKPLIGGLLMGGATLAGQYAIGVLYSDAAPIHLLRTFIPQARSLAVGIVTASATVLALLLTILSMVISKVDDLQTSFYLKVRRIALYNTIALVSSLLILLLFNFPIEEGQAIPNTWFVWIYYILVTLVASITGLFVGTMLMLYGAVEDIIRIFHPERDSTLVGK
jgi:hypothetical protein